MSLGNYTVPFVTPSPTEFLNVQNFGPMPQAVAINSLLHETPAYGQKTPIWFSPSPSRHQSLSSKKVKDNRDPYRNQYGSRIQYRVDSNQADSRQKSANNYDDYFHESDYDGEQNEENYDISFSDDQFDEKISGTSTSKVKRKFKTVQEPRSTQQEDQSTTQEWQPHLPPTYKRISNTFNSISEPGSKTSLHAVIDFDDDFDDYNYDEEDLESETHSKQKTPMPQVTPIEGPIFIKNGSVPVVPLYSYPVVNNGTLIQIPILWTALSLALGFEIHGEIIRGVPCIKRHHQLFCPTAGNKYPTEKIERFIEDNKALMKRMYGEFQISTEYSSFSGERFHGRKNVKRQTHDSGSDPPINPQVKPDSYFGKHRSSRVDACESKIEIVTPYWASNSAGKIRAIVNTKHFEQAIHQEVCSKVQTKRCVGDCGCEQKYKWHRLLAYDPDNDCKGIFMDWFLFPSCCVCRCSPIGN